MPKKAHVLIILIVFAAALIGPISLNSGLSPSGNAGRFFPREKLMEIGVYYHPEHWPESEWDRDPANIALSASPSSTWPSSPGLSSNRRTAGSTSPGSNGARAPFVWNNWADVLEPAPGTETLAVYADQFYAGKAAATFRKLGRGTVTYVGADTDDGRLERKIVRRIYARARIPFGDLPEGVYVEWRDGFFVAVNYSSAPFDLPLPPGATILIGDRRVEPADVCVWTEK
jgi:beta-galactosidase GanA